MALSSSNLPFALVAVTVSPLPATSSFIYIGLGALLHVGYQLLLLNSYRFGDLSKVYPIARGGAPLIAALISTVFLGVEFGSSQLSALVIIGIGIFSLAIDSFRVKSDDSLTSSLLAVFTGVFIAAYSLVDGMGAREAGTAVGFYGWLSLLNAIIFGVIARNIRPGLIKSTFSRPFSKMSAMSSWPHLPMKRARNASKTRADCTSARHRRCT